MQMKNKLVLVALLTGVSLPVFAQDAAAQAASTVGATPVQAPAVVAPKTTPTPAQAVAATKAAIAAKEAAPTMPSAADELFKKSQVATEKSDTVKSADDPYSGSSWILFAGAGAVALMGWGATQWKRRQNDFSGNAIEQINSLTLGPKHRVSVIEVDGKRLLIGLTDGHMSVLSDLGRAEPKEDKASEIAWKEALTAARARVFADVTAETPRPVANPITENSGMFQGFERKPAQPRQNRETDSVMIGLKALEQRARR
jgi:hypothetical protein